MGRHLTTGYSQLFDFLDNLAVNNDRQWFAENRHLYDYLRKQWLADLQTLIGHMVQSEPALRHTDAASCAYRIYRDIRFSHDKSPFKTYFSALISAHGRHTDRACWYLHMGADECGIYGGLWNPPGPMLRKVRQAVVDNVDEFRQIIATPFRCCIQSGTEHNSRPYPKASTATIPMPTSCALRNMAVAIRCRAASSTIPTGPESLPALP